MVKLHLKNGDEDQFLYETSIDASTKDLILELVNIYNGRLKVMRICAEMEDLAKHGVCLPPNMQGLTEDQVKDLKLKDEWGEKCIPSGGIVESKDPIGRRNGKAPIEKMAEIINKTVAEAKAAISKKLIANNVCLTEATIVDTLRILQGATMIVYPMGLPPHETIRLEFENKEQLEGTQASLEVIEPSEARLWWAGKEIFQDKKLSNYIGKNEKTKIIAKIQKHGQGAPGREPIISESDRKEMMLHAYQKQEELKKLMENNDDGYLNSKWADGDTLKNACQGIKNIRWKP